MNLTKSILLIMIGIIIGFSGKYLLDILMYYPNAIKESKRAFAETGSEQPEINNSMISDKIFVPAIPNWEYDNYDSTMMRKREASDFGRVIIIKDTSVIIGSGTFYTKEAEDTFYLGEGDGGVIYTGIWRTIPQGLEIEYKIAKTWNAVVLKEENDSNRKIFIDTMRNEIIMDGGLAPFPVRNLNGKLYAENQKAFWKFGKESIDFIYAILKSSDE